MVDQITPATTPHHQHSHFKSLKYYLPTFSSRLFSQGYSPATIYSKNQIVRNFIRWIDSQHLKICELNELSIDSFFEDHPRAGHVRRGDLSTLHSLLEWLRNLGLTRELPTETDDSPLHIIGNDFSDYLEEVRGLSQSTLQNYLPVIHRFLTESFSSDIIVVNELGPQNITRFVLRHANIMNCRSAQLMTTALRSFFRFLRFRGDISTDLAAVVPTVANWQLSEIPKSLDTEEVEQLLQSCDPTTATGKRNLAILLLLARLGLRAGEIVAMTLDEINWENGVITIPGKGSRRDQLPIPHDVGEALSIYLCHGRPPCETRRVFIRARAPRQGFSSSSAIDDIVRRSLVRAGLNPIRKGAHLLRHSLATKMLKRGACLAEIGEVLRHSSTKTTEIYAKVDLAALSALAQPWPGGDV